MSKVVATFAGDSGDGVQLLGGAFTDVVAQLLFDYNTLPDFPAEIRAPAGTYHGVSGFQIQWGNESIQNAGHLSDVLVAFNAAGLKKYLPSLKPNGLLIYDPDGFDSKNISLAKFDILELESLSCTKIAIEFSKLTTNSLSELDITAKDKAKNKNIFALGYLLFGLGGDLVKAKKLLKSRFKSNQSVLDILFKALEQGYYFAETTEFIFHQQARNENVYIPSKKYKNISGNKGIVYALLAAPKVFGRSLFFGGYPITPASEILHELTKYQFREIIVKQAEDEISAASMALGASYGGAIGVTASSGPGIDLKQEVIGLAHMAELPLLIIDIQRAGPSTGMPTKVEQSDLLATLYGRHGDTPVPVLAIRSPEKAYDTTLAAIEIMIRYQTPVFLLSDAQIANASAPWEIPDVASNFIATDDRPELVKPWIMPGQIGNQKTIGGLERDVRSGQISYDGINHESATYLRQAKVLSIADTIPPQRIDHKCKHAQGLVIGWGSTYGVLTELFADATIPAAKKLDYLHLDWIFPLPKNFVELVSAYEFIIIPELNAGQLSIYLRDCIQKPIWPIHKIQGIPFYKEDLIPKFEEILTRYEA